MTSAQSIGFPLLYHLSSSPFYFEGQLHPNKIPTVPVAGILKPSVKGSSNLVVSDSTIAHASSMKLSKFLSASVKPVQATNLNLTHPKGQPLDIKQSNKVWEEKEHKKETVKKSLSEKIEEDNNGHEHFSLFEELHAAETRVLAQLKSIQKDVLQTNEEKRAKNELWRDITELNLKKKRILSFFVDSENKDRHSSILSRSDVSSQAPSASNVLSSSANLPTNTNNNNNGMNGPCLANGPSVVNVSISQQPADFAVANRYLMPPPTVVAQNLNKVDNNSTLVVSARLFYHEQEEEMTKTQDGKQEVLQGIKKVSLDKGGRAVFNKLKIMEVSSKHKHQAFCLVFFLEEYTSQGLKKTLAKVKSAPFHVQSRSNKRKREGEDDPMSPLRALLKTSSAALFSTSSSTSPAIASSVEKEESDSEGSNEETEKNDNEVESEQEHEEPEPEDTIATVSTTSPTEEVGNYIDITDLLVLPQKEAARRLGISESMLCKRFKECTKRKWPYRYLRKIDKVMNLLSLPKMDGAMSKEDREKLEQLKKEREDCLKPVKIRITAHDKLNAFSSSMGILTTSGSSSTGSNYNMSQLSNSSASTPTTTSAPNTNISPSVGSSILGSGILSGSASSAFSPKESSKTSSQRQSPAAPTTATNSGPATSTSSKQETIEDEIPTDVLETLEMLKGTLKEENNNPTTTSAMNGMNGTNTNVTNSTNPSSASPGHYNSGSYSSTVPSPSSSFSFAPSHTPTPSFSASSSCPSFPCTPSSSSSSSILSSFVAPSFFASSSSPSAPSSPQPTSAPESAPSPGTPPQTPLPSPTPPSAVAEAMVTESTK